MITFIPLVAPSSLIHLHQGHHLVAPDLFVIPKASSDFLNAPERHHQATLSSLENQYICQHGCVTLVIESSIKSPTRAISTP